MTICVMAGILTWNGSDFSGWSCAFVRAWCGAWLLCLSSEVFRAEHRSNSRTASGTSGLLGGA